MSGLWAGAVMGDFLEEVKPKLPFYFLHSYYYTSKA